MVKVLLLEQWYNLSDPQMSDPQMEEALEEPDLLPTLRGAGSCRRMPPDHSTISRFRTALAGRGEVRGPLYCR